MPVPTDITAGTLTITNGSTAVTGVGTSWLASDLRQGDVILWIEGGDGFQTPILADVPASNTALTLVEPWEGPTLTGVRYRIRYQWDSSRVSAQSRQLIELLDNGNILALASLTGPGVPVFDGPHSMTIRPTQDFINGVAYDVQVDTLADRVAYDGQAEGFSVLVSDVGDGRSAVYSKASNTSGDWTEPAYVTGPVGSAPDVAAGTTTTLPPGSDATFEVDPDGSGGYLLSAGIPAGRGLTPRGTYNPATEYVLDDAVLDNGSTWIALQTTIGNAPPVLPVTSDAYWQLLARKGTDGSGTGDVVGPAVAVNNRLAVFDGTTGKLLKDGGVTVSGLEPARAKATQSDAEGAGTTILGWAPEQIAQAVRYHSPPVDVSALALQVADNTNTAIFGANWVADAFDALTYVDVSGATNLDTSTPGVLKPSGGGNDSFTKVLLHFDGTDGSTTITDSNAGGSAHTWTANGNAQLDTGVTPKFGSASLLLDGTGDYVSMPDSSDITFGTAPFTIDMWFRVGGGAGTRRALFGQSTGASDPATSFFIELDTSNRLVAYVGNGTTLTAVTGTSTFAVSSTWHHVEFVRTGNILKLFANGNQEGGDVAFTGSVLDATGILSVGAIGNFASLMWNGNIDEFRISAGIARHTSNFTPASVSYGSVSNLSVNYLAAPSAEVPATMAATIQVRGSSLVPGTDYAVDFRRSIGGAWVSAALGDVSMTPSGVALVKVETTDVSSLPSGNVPSVRLRTLTNKMVEFHGLHLEFYGAAGGWVSGGSP